MSCNDARNVESVRGRLGEHVRIAVGIVVCKGNFCVIIYVIQRNGLTISDCREIVELFADIALRYCKSILRRHLLECRMTPVKTCIEHSNCQPFAGITILFCYVRGIINTCRIDADFVYCGFRSGHVIAF